MSSQTTRRSRWLAATLTVALMVLSAPAGAGTDGGSTVNDDGACPVWIPPHQFNDVPTASPHYGAVGCVRWWGITGGQTAGLYGASGTVTRAQMATFVARTVEHATGELPRTTGMFSDVSGNPHRASIEKLATAEIIGGHPDGTYRPSLRVTRAQMATFLVRAWEHLSGETLEEGEIDFPDIGGSAHAASIRKMVAAGFAGGFADGTYRPSRDVTRVQMATFLANVVDRAVRGGHADMLLPPAERQGWLTPEHVWADDPAFIRFSVTSPPVDLGGLVIDFGEGTQLEFPDTTIVYPFRTDPPKPFLNVYTGEGENTLADVYLGLGEGVIPVEGAVTLITRDGTVVPTGYSYSETTSMPPGYWPGVWGAAEYTPGGERFWVYNAGGQPGTLDGYTVSSNVWEVLHDGEPFPIPDGTTLPPVSYHPSHFPKMFEQLTVWLGHGTSDANNLYLGLDDPGMFLRPTFSTNVYLYDSDGEMVAQAEVYDQGYVHPDE